MSDERGGLMEAPPHEGGGAEVATHSGACLPRVQPRRSLTWFHMQ